MNQEQLRQALLAKTPKNVILDTDTYNEVDDQFALAYAMLSPDRVRLLAVTAAPFFNERSDSAGDGMLKSYREIGKIMELVRQDAGIPYYKGAVRFLTPDKEPVASEASEAIVRTVMNAEDPVFIVAIGAITNVASAILQCPELVSRAAVIWLGGHALHYPNTAEFNLGEDPAAAQVVFDSGIPLLQIPCGGVCTEFLTTLPELEAYLAGKNRLCDYLVEIVRAYSKGQFAWSKVIWDVTAIAALTLPEAMDTVLLPRPFISSDCRYSFDAARRPYLYVRKLRRDPIYGDLFRKLGNIPEYIR